MTETDQDSRGQESLAGALLRVANRMPRQAEVENAERREASTAEALDVCQGEIGQRRGRINALEGPILKRDRLRRLVAEPEVFQDADIDAARRDLPAAEREAAPLVNEVMGLRKEIAALERNEVELSRAATNAHSAAERLRKRQRRVVAEVERLLDEDRREVLARSSAEALNQTRAGRKRLALWGITAVAAGLTVVSSLGIAFGALPNEWPGLIPLALCVFSVGYGIYVWDRTRRGPAWFVYGGPAAAVLISAAFVVLAGPVKSGQREAEQAFARYTAGIKPLTGDTYVELQLRGFLEGGDDYRVCRNTNTDRRLCGWVDRS